VDGGVPNNMSDNSIRAPVPRSREMHTEVHTITVAIYLGELFFATTLAIALLVISTSRASIVIVLFCSVAVSRYGRWLNTSPIALCCMLSPRYSTEFITHGREMLSTRSSGKYGWPSPCSTRSWEALRWPAFLLPMPGIYWSIIAPITIPQFCRPPR
jgi:hypothetical protein